MRRVLEYRQLNNDLYADYCCPQCHKRTLLSGYNDSYFFERVNAAPREMQCQCGHKLTVQWTRAGVVIDDQAGGEQP